MAAEPEHAYVLHMRPFRESSQLVEAITRGQGRVGLIARGARRPKSRWRGILRPFQPLRIAWVGKGELGTLRSVEQAPLSIELSGDNLLAGFYINELLLRLAGRNDPHPNLFAHYSRAIGELADGQMLEPILRTFEIDMLAELGYGINLRTDSMTHAPLSSNAHYAFHPEEGPVSVSAGRDKSFPGDVLLAIGKRQFADAEVLGAARRLLRQVIDHHLGDRELRTRTVLRDMRRHG